MKNDILTYFTTNNKSGYKTREKWLKDHNYDLYKKIIDNSDENDISFKEKVYLYIHDFKNVPRCPYCNKKVHFKSDLKKGYNKYCSIQCLNKSKEHKEKIKQTYIKKYGVNSHNKVKEIKEEKKQTYIKKYGVENPFASKEIQEKIKQTNLKKYGVDNPMKIKNVLLKREKNIIEGKEKNILRVINKIKKDYIFIEHKNGVFTLKHRKCNNIFNIDANLLDSRYMLNKTICLYCNPKKSYNSLFELIKDTFLNFNYIKNDRKILNGKELDIYIPDKKIGIEINGNYWHSNIYKKNDYHLKKTKLAESKNIQLIHLFEDEIIYKNEIVKSIIKSKLGIFDQRIYARKCEIREITNNEQIRQFLNENHLQGFIGSKIKIGLFYENELVSLMTFGSLRRALGNKNTNKNEYEMFRYATKLNTQVVGGASKMFKYFLKTYNPKKIISYANRRYSQGKLYEKLGFEKVGDTKPNYWYIKRGSIKREYRFKYRKQILVKMGFDKNKSESEIMKELKYYKIYDSGQLKFSYLM